MKEIKYTTVSVNFCDSIFIKFTVPVPETRINYGSGSGSNRSVFKLRAPVPLRQKVTVPTVPEHCSISIKSGIFLGFFSMYCIQHCFICRPSDSEDAGIEPRTVATSALAVRRSTLG